MTSPALGAAPRARIPASVIVGFTLLLLAGRLLSGHFVAFFGLDEISLACGVAALVQDSIGYVYRYGPQAGYYQLVRVLDQLAGSDIRAIPIIMIWLSAVAGTVIPICGFFLYRDELSRVERLLLAGLLASNPILWMSSTYGNSAMPSVALLVVGITILLNKPRPIAEGMGLALFGAAIFVRADAVLAFPAVTVMLYQRHRSIRTVIARVAPLAVALGALYGTLMLADPHMGEAVGGVKEHLTGPFLTRFWDYLVWSTSPIILAFAVVGFRQLLAERRELSLVVTTWCLPFFAFYFASTTQPRYFLPTVVPVAMCAAVGMVSLVPLLAARRPWMAWASLVVLATLHLFVGLSHFTPASPRSVVEQSQFETQVGPLWTGALLYKSYLTPSFLGRSLRQPGFGRGSRLGEALDSSLAKVASGAARDRTIVVVPAGWNRHLFHFYAHVHGAKYVSRKPGTFFNSETRMSLGGARLVWTPVPSDDARATELPALADGDQVWMISPTTTEDSALRSRLPLGVTLKAYGDTAAPWLRTYRVERTAP